MSEVSPSPQPTTTGVPAPWSPAPRHLWAAIVALFVVVNTPVWVTEQWASRLLSGVAVMGSGEVFPDGGTSGFSAYNSLVIVPCRRLLFLVAVGYLLYGIGREVRRQWRAEAGMGIWNGIWSRSALVFLGLSVLCVPFLHTNILVEQGVDYAEMSEDPFALPKGRGWEWQRLLKPALASFLQLSGPVPYLLFSLAITFLLIVLCQRQLRQSPVGPQEPPALPPIPLLTALGVGSCSFLLWDFSAPGYGDSLAYVGVLLLAGFGLSRSAVLAVVALLLATHEATVVMVVPVTVLLLPRAWWWRVAAVIGLYGFIYLAAQGFSLGAYLGSHCLPGQPESFMVSAWHRFSPVPGRLLAAWKWFWLLPVVLLLVVRTRAEWRAYGVCLGLLLLPQGVNFLAADNYRLGGGYGFLGLLGLVSLTWRQAQARRWLRILLVVVSVLAFLTPPWGSGTQLGVHYDYGYYRLVYPVGSWFLALLGLAG